MQSVHSKLRSIVGRADLHAVHGDESLKQSILLVVDSLCGFAEATRVDSATILFRLLCPAACDVVTLLGSVSLKSRSSVFQIYSCEKVVDIDVKYILSVYRTYVRFCLRQKGS